MSGTISAVLLVCNMILNVNGQQKSRTSLLTNTVSIPPSILDTKSLANVVELSRENNKNTGRDQTNNQLQTIFTLNDKSAVQALNPTVPNLFSHAMNLQSALKRQKNDIRSRDETIKKMKSVGTTIIGPHPIPKSQEIPGNILLNGNSVLGTQDMHMLDPINLEISARHSGSMHQHSVQLSPNRQLQNDTLVTNKGVFGLSNENENIARLMNDFPEDGIQEKSLNLNKRAIEAPIRGVVVDNSFLKESLSNNGLKPSELQTETGFGEVKNLFDTAEGNQFGLLNQQVKDGLSTGNIELLERAPMPMWLQQQIENENTVPSPNSVFGLGFDSDLTHSNTGDSVSMNNIPSSNDVISNFDTRLPDIADYTTGVDALNKQTNDFYAFRHQGALEINPTVGDREIEQLINNVVLSVDQNSAQQNSMSEGNISENAGLASLPQPTNSNILFTQNWQPQSIVPPLNPNTLNMQSVASQRPVIQTEANVFSRTPLPGLGHHNTGFSTNAGRQVVSSGQVLQPGFRSSSTSSVMSRTPGTAIVGTTANRQLGVATNQNLISTQGGLFMPNNPSSFPNQPTMQNLPIQGSFVANSNPNTVPNQPFIQTLPQQGGLLMNNNPNSVRNLPVTQRFSQQGSTLMNNIPNRILSQTQLQRSPQQSRILTTNNMNTIPNQLSSQGLPRQGGMGMINNPNPIPNQRGLQGFSSQGRTVNNNPITPLQQGLPTGSNLAFNNLQRPTGIQFNRQMGQVSQNSNQGLRHLLNIPTTPVDRNTALRRIQDALRRSNPQQIGQNDISRQLRQIAALLVNSNNARGTPNFMRPQNDSINLRNDNVVNRLLQSIDFPKYLSPGQILMIYPRGTVNNSTLTENRDTRIQRLTASSVRSLLGQLLTQPSPQDNQQSRANTRSRSSVSSSRNTQTRARPTIQQSAATSVSQRPNNQSQTRRSRQPGSRNIPTQTTTRVQQPQSQVDNRISRINHSRSSSVRIGQRRAATG